MGIDIYRLSNNKRQAVTTVDGDLVRPYVYGQKLTYNWNYEQAQARWLERCHNNCPDGSGLVTIPTDWRTEKIGPGDPVYYASELQGVWYDCDTYPGVCVGYLNKVGRGKWEIHSQAKVVTERLRALVRSLPAGRRLEIEERAPLSEGVRAEVALSHADAVIKARVRNGVLYLDELPANVKAVYDARDSLRGALAGSGLL